MSPSKVARKVSVFALAAVVCGYAYTKTSMAGEAHERRASHPKIEHRPASAGAALTVPPVSSAKDTNLHQVIAALAEYERGHPSVPSRSEDDELEDELMEMYDHARTPMQRAWRATFVQEDEDPAWTARMKEEIGEVAKAGLLEGGVRIDDLSCRETICRTLLQFGDQLDAKAFIEAPRDPALNYEFQSLDPTFSGEGFDKSEHTYEMLVKRSRPAGLPHRDRARAREPFFVRANEAEPSTMPRDSSQPLD